MVKPPALSPLQRVMGSFGRVWRPAEQAGACAVERNVGGVPGLHVCRNFLSVEEVGVRASGASGA